MQKITNDPLDTIKIFARFGTQMPAWAYTCVAAGYVPPETEVEFQATKHLHPEIGAIETTRAAIRSMEAAALKALITGDPSHLEREHCAQLCEKLDPVAGAKFAEAIRARSEPKKKAKDCSCGAAH